MAANSPLGPRFARENAPDSGTTHTCSSFMLLLHHQIHRRNRWVGLTLTFEPLKLHDETLATLQRKGILTTADVQQIVKAARVAKPLRVK
jgi:hypothetical protein